MAESKTVAVIMAGGSGTRFWPASTKELPKQFLNLLGSRSLIQTTWDRILPVVSEKNIFVCSAKSQEQLLHQHVPKAPLILEPAGKNTSACLALSLLYLQKAGFAPETVMIALPADHYISQPDRFRSYLKDAAACAREHQGLVTLGIKPTHAHTGYGYIEAGDAISTGAHSVRRFVEKPDSKLADEYFKKGTFYWNSGIFVWTLQALSRAFQEWMPELWQTLQDASSLETVYRDLPAIPIDKGILEKAKNVYVIRTDMGWSDVGSWSALCDLLRDKTKENVIQGGQVVAVQSQGCFVRAGGDRKIALIGVEDLIVVEENGYLLICSRSDDQLVRDAAKHFKSDQ